MCTIEVFYHENTLYVIATASREERFCFDAALVYYSRLHSIRRSHLMNTFFQNLVYVFRYEYACRRNTTKLDIPILSKNITWYVLIYWQVLLFTTMTSHNCVIVLCLVRTLASGAARKAYRIYPCDTWIILNALYEEHGKNLLALFLKYWCHCVIVWQYIWWWEKYQIIFSNLGSVMFIIIYIYIICIYIYIYIYIYTYIYLLNSTCWVRVQYTRQ